MCRILAYLGPELSVEELLLAPEHSLVVQSYQPKEMRGAILNADGFGVAWYTAAASEPGLYRSVLPMWADDNLPRMASHLRSGCVLANVRSATPGIGMGLANTQPFVRGDLAFTHNGLLGGFRPGLMRSIQARLDDEAFAALEGTSDSEHVFALILAHLEGEGPEALERALREGLKEASELASRAGERALLNVALSDGRCLVAARYAVGAEAPSLYLRERAVGGRGVAIASEPGDGAEAWKRIGPSRVLSVASDGTVVVSDL